MVVVEITKKDGSYDYFEIYSDDISSIFQSICNRFEYLAIDIINKDLPFPERQLYKLADLKNIDITFLEDKKDDKK